MGLFDDVVQRVDDNKQLQLYVAQVTGAKLRKFETGGYIWFVGDLPDYPILTGTGETPALALDAFVGAFYG